MSRVRAVFLSLIVLSSTATIARAQFPGMGGSTRPISLVISGGMTLPAGDLGDFHDAGMHFDAALLLNIPGLPLALRPEFSLTRFKLKDLTVPTPGATGDVTQMITAMGNIELPLMMGLYALAGGGIMQLNVPDQATGGTEESSTSFMFDAGAGFRFSLGPARGFIEARVGAASYEQGKFGFTKAQFIPITLGLVF